MAKLRQEDEIRAADVRARVAGWRVRPGLAERVAVRLRRLADRIDGRAAARLETYSGG